jgi:hypothetical protein
MTTVKPLILVAVFIARQLASREAPMRLRAACTDVGAVPYPVPPAGTEKGRFRSGWIELSAVYALD